MNLENSQEVLIKVPIDKPLQKTTYFFVDKDGTEGVSNTKPIRDRQNGFWICPRVCGGHIVDDLVELPKGTFKALGIEISWDDAPYTIVSD